MLVVHDKGKETFDCEPCEFSFGSKAQLTAHKTKTHIEENLSDIPQISKDEADDNPQMSKDGFYDNPQISKDEPDETAMDNDPEITNEDLNHEDTSMVPTEEAFEDNGKKHKCNQCPKSFATKTVIVLISTWIMETSPKSFQLEARKKQLTIENKLLN